jgi:formamidopyrimidine-DNA glycosylase
MKCPKCGKEMVRAVIDGKIVWFCPRCDKIGKK